MSLRSVTITILQILTILIVFSLIVHCSSNRKVIIENSHFRYEISKEGKNLHFIDKLSGTDYLNSDSVSFCAKLNYAGKDYKITKVSMKGSLLELVFGDANTTVGLRIKISNDYVNIKVESVNGQADALTFINIPLTLEGMPYEPFAGCVLSMNLFTRVRELPALQSNLWATCYTHFGTEGAEVMLIGVPGEQILSVIRDVMSQACDIPHSDKGGAWALSQKEGYGSYLMNFGTLTEETVDEWISMCRSLGFNQIDNHVGSDFFRFGDFELNRGKWPEGWQTYKKINDRLHEAGISSIFHTYAFFIDKNTKYVTPVPSKDLGLVQQCRQDTTLVQ
jgi:hypothetical protein